MDSDWETFFNSNLNILDLLYDKKWVELLKNNNIFLNHIIIYEFLKNEYTINKDTKELFPLPKYVFNSLNLCSPNTLKVVILGQDPYHNYKKNNNNENVPEAMGLAFSVLNNISKKPPSLKNIIKELNNDLNLNITNSDLTNWANQGVLLLNTSLTVLQKTPGKHIQVWTVFTNSLIKMISDEFENIIFLLWGNHAKEKIDFIDTAKHHVLTAAHPSPLSANRGNWFNCKHFSKTNEILNSLNKEPILWEI